MNSTYSAKQQWGPARGQSPMHHPGPASHREVDAGKHLRAPLSHRFRGGGHIARFLGGQRAWRLPHGFPDQLAQVGL